MSSARQATHQDSDSVWISENMLPKEGVLIHRWLPISTGTKQSSGNLLFLTVFRFLKF
jgi:hypothetical protein